MRSLSVIRSEPSESHRRTSGSPKYHVGPSQAVVGSRGTRPHFRTTRIARGARAAIAEDGGYALCNAGLIDLGGLTVVFDSMLTPMAGSLLAREARRCTGRGADFVVNSHWHGDHIRGNASLRPARVVSTEKTRDLISSLGPEQWADDRKSMGAALRELNSPSTEVPANERALYRGWFEGTLAVPLPFSPVPPSLTFETELRIHGTQRELRIMTFGGGHSPSDAFAYLPEERVVFLGDLLSVGLHPSAGDGIPWRWAQILRKIRRLGVDVAVPGHGPVGSDREIRQIESYLQHLDRRAGAAHRAGRSVEELSREPVPESFRRWKFSAFYGENLARAFRFARPQGSVVP